MLTYNTLSSFPTCYGARLDDQYYLVGEGKALDPRKYFIVTFALFSNGEVRLNMIPLSSI